MFEYEIKRLPELGWAVLVAAVAFAAQVVATTDPHTVTDWRAYAIGVAAGLGRVLFVALLKWIGIAGDAPAAPPSPPAP